MSYTVVSYSDDTKGVGFYKVVVLLGILCRKLYTITRLAWHIVSNPAVSRLSVTLPPLIRPDSANFRHIRPIFSYQRPPFDTLTLQPADFRGNVAPFDKIRSEAYSLSTRVATFRQGTSRTSTQFGTFHNVPTKSAILRHRSPSVHVEDVEICNFNRTKLTLCQKV